MRVAGELTDKVESRHSSLLLIIDYHKSAAIEVHDILHKTLLHHV
jgi:hypothetical protein